MANTRQQQTEQLITSALDDNSQYSEAVLCRTTRIISLSALVLLVLLVWAAFARLDEVSAGTGKVVPSAREFGIAWVVYALFGFGIFLLA